MYCFFQIMEEEKFVPIIENKLNKYYLKYALEKM